MRVFNFPSAAATRALLVVTFALAALLVSSERTQISIQDDVKPHAKLAEALAADGYAFVEIASELSPTTTCSVETVPANAPKLCCEGLLCPFPEGTCCSTQHCCPKGSRCLNTYDGQPQACVKETEPLNPDQPPQNTSIGFLRYTPPPPKPEPELPPAETPEGCEVGEAYCKAVEEVIVNSEQWESAKTVPRGFFDAKAAQAPKQADTEGKDTEQAKKPAPPTPKELKALFGTKGMPAEPNSDPDEKDQPPKPLVKKSANPANSTAKASSAKAAKPAAAAAPASARFSVDGSGDKSLDEDDEVKLDVHEFEKENQQLEEEPQGEPEHDDADLLAEVRFSETREGEQLEQPSGGRTWSQRRGGYSTPPYTHRPVERAKPDPKAPKRETKTAAAEPQPTADESDDDESDSVDMEPAIVLPPLPPVKTAVQKQQEKLEESELARLKEAESLGISLDGLTPSEAAMAIEAKKMANAVTAAVDDVVKAVTDVSELVKLYGPDRVRSQKENETALLKEVEGKRKDVEAEYIKVSKELKEWEIKENDRQRKNAERWARQDEQWQKFEAGVEKQYQQKRKKIVDEEKAKDAQRAKELAAVEKRLKDEEDKVQQGLKKSVQDSVTAKDVLQKTTADEQKSKSEAQSQLNAEKVAADLFYQKQAAFRKSLEEKEKAMLKQRADRVAKAKEEDRKQADEKQEQDRKQIEMAKQAEEDQKLQEDKKAADLQLAKARIELSVAKSAADRAIRAAEDAQKRAEESKVGIKLPATDLNAEGSSLDTFDPIARAAVAIVQSKNALDNARKARDFAAEAAANLEKRKAEEGVACQAAREAERQAQTALEALQKVEERIAADSTDPALEAQFREAKSASDLAQDTSSAAAQSCLQKQASVKLEFDKAKEANATATRLEVESTRLAIDALYYEFNKTVAMMDLDDAQIYQDVFDNSRIQDETVGVQNLDKRAVGPASKNPVPATRVKFSTPVALQFRSNGTAVRPDFLRAQYVKLAGLCFASGAGEYPRLGADNAAILRLPKECSPTKPAFHSLALYQPAFPGKAPSTEDFLSHGLLQSTVNSSVTLSVDATTRKALGNKRVFIPFNRLVIPSADASARPLVIADPWIDSSVSKPQFYRVGDFCLFDGVVSVKSTSHFTKANGVLGSVPVECKPSDGNRLIFTVPSNGSFHRIDVTPSGQFVWADGTVTDKWLSLNGIAFFPDAGKARRIQLRSGFSPVDSTFARPELIDSYRPPSYKRSSHLCVLSGVFVSRQGANTTVGTLPAYCRPSEDIVVIASQHLTFTRLVIRASGAIVYWGAKDAWTSLDGVFFAVDPLLTRQRAEALLLRNMMEDVDAIAKRISNIEVPQGVRQKVKEAIEKVGKMSNDTSKKIRNVVQQRDAGSVSISKAQEEEENEDEEVSELTKTAYNTPKTLPLNVSALTEGYFDAVGTPYALPSAVLVGKFCFLSGLIRRTDKKAPNNNFTNLFTLPPKCRPEKDLSVSIQVSPYEPAIELKVTVQGSLSSKRVIPLLTEVSLDGLSFPVASSLFTGITLNTARGWKNFGANTNRASFFKEGSICQLSGAVFRDEGAATEPEGDDDLVDDAFRYDRIGKLGAQCRPKEGKVVFHTADNQRIEVLPQGLVMLAWRRSEPMPSYFSLEHLFFPTVPSPLNLTLLNKYQPIGKGFKAPSVFKQGAFCALSGTLMGIGDTQVARLPSSCRPYSALQFTVATQNGPERVEISVAGIITRPYSEEKPDWISLDGISYVLDSADYLQLQQQLTNDSKELRATVAQFALIEPKSSYANLPESLMVPNTARVGPLCVFSGSFRAASLSAGDLLASLPADCRPSGTLVFSVGTSKGPVRVDIDKNGNLRYVSGPTPSVLSIGALTFMADKHRLAREGGINPASPFSNQADKESAYADPRFTTFGGICTLSGLMRAAPTSFVPRMPQASLMVGNLPYECRPHVTSLRFAVLRGNVSRTIEINSKGEILLLPLRGDNSTGGWLSLAGVSFVTSLHLKFEPRVEYVRPLQGAVVRDADPNAPDTIAMTRQGSLCLLSGLSNVAGQDVATLPTWCRPARTVHFNAPTDDGVEAVEINQDGSIVLLKQPKKPNGTEPSFRIEFPPVLSLDGILFALEPEPVASKASLLELSTEQPKAPAAAAASKAPAGAAAASNAPAVAAAVSKVPDLAAAPKAAQIQRSRSLSSLLQDLRLSKLKTVVGAYEKPLSAEIELDGSSFFRYGEGYLSPHFSRVGRVCQLSGRASVIDLSEPITTLPPNCRPTFDSVFNALSANGTMVRIDVSKKGVVAFKEGSAGKWLSLDSIRFPVSDSLEAPLPVTQFYNGFLNYGGDWGEVSTFKDGDLCVLSGVIRAQSVSLWSSAYDQPELSPEGDIYEPPFPDEATTALESAMDEARWGLDDELKASTSALKRQTDALAEQQIRQDAEAKAKAAADVAEEAAAAAAPAAPAAPNATQNKTAASDDWRANVQEREKDKQSAEAALAASVAARAEQDQKERLKRQRTNQYAQTQRRVRDVEKVVQARKGVGKLKTPRPVKGSVAVPTIKRKIIKQLEEVSRKEAEAIIKAKLEPSSDAGPLSTTAALADNGVQDGGDDGDVVQDDGEVVQDIGEAGQEEPIESLPDDEAEGPPGGEPEPEAREPVHTIPLSASQGTPERKTPAPAPQEPTTEIASGDQAEVEPKGEQEAGDEISMIPEDDEAAPESEPEPAANGVTPKVTPKPTQATPKPSPTPAPEPTVAKKDEFEMPEKEPAFSSEPTEKLAPHEPEAASIVTAEAQKTGAQARFRSKDVAQVEDKQASEQDDRVAPPSDDDFDSSLLETQAVASSSKAFNVRARRLARATQRSLKSSTAVQAVRGAPIASLARFASARAAAEARVRVRVRARVQHRRARTHIGVRVKHHLRHIEDGETGLILARLPSSCRPDTRLVYNVNHNRISHRVDVLPSGELVWVGGQKEVVWLALDGLAFFQNSGSPLELRFGYAPVAEGYRAPSFRLQGAFCALSGSLYQKYPLDAADPSANRTALVAKLPAPCRPAGGRLVFFTAAESKVFRVDILPNGELQWPGGVKVENLANPLVLTLDGISFVADPQYEQKEKQREEEALFQAEKLTAAAETHIGPIASTKLAEGFEPWHIPKSDPGLVEKAVACDGQPLNIYCNAKLHVLNGYLKTNYSVIRIHSAFFGRMSAKVCPVNNAGAKNSSCRADVVNVLQDRCEGRHQCQTLVSSLLFPDRCKDVKKYLEVEYSCDTKAPPATTKYSYQPPAFARLGKLCALSGMIQYLNATHRTQIPLLTVPDDCVPSSRILAPVLHETRGLLVSELYKNGSLAMIARDNQADKAGATYSLNHVLYPANGSTITPLLVTRGYMAYGGDKYLAPGFVLEGDFCSLSGALSINGSSDALKKFADDPANPIAILPHACRPQYRLSFAVLADIAKHQIVEITPQGEVFWKFEGARASWISLNGVGFFKGQSGAPLQKLELLNSWSHAGEDWSLPTAKKQGDLCALSGRLSIAGAKELIVAKVPQVCKPSAALTFAVPRGNNLETITISKEGVVEWTKGYIQAGWLSLDNIHYIAPR